MGLALDEPKENEQTTYANGIGVLIADSASPFVANARVDYVEGPYGDAFTVTARGEDC